MVPPSSHGDSSCPAVLWIRLAYFRSFRVRDSHPVSSAFPCSSTNLSSLNAVLTPEILLPLVWPSPLSLATTSGISVDFFSSPYLDVSVQAVPFTYLCIQYMIHSIATVWVSPFGNPRIKNCICVSPRLIAACRVLHRLLSAKAFPLRSFSLTYF